ncbi:MAG: DUF370 domain-containing protein [Acutalibacteraceae bacterium]|nr:DUF370 domain-containing protein [Acutalibacteraceae bacterium]
MYIHLGNNIMLPTNEIIGIFDLENTSVSKRTRDFLKKAEKAGRVITVSYDLPRSFVVAGKNKDDIKVYISQISSSTLLKRTGYIDSL